MATDMFEFQFTVHRAGLTGTIQSYNFAGLAQLQGQNYKVGVAVGGAADRAAALYQAGGGPLLHPVHRQHLRHLHHGLLGRNS